MEINVLRTGPYQTNTYIIIDNGDAVVIDPGDGTEQITGFLKEKNAQARYVLLTHTHFDHIGSVAALQELGAEVYVSLIDYLILEEARKTPEYKHIKPFTPDRIIIDGEWEELNGNVIKVMETPGHTPGGLCYILNEKYIFTGDTLFRMSIGRTDLPHGDYEELISSVKKLLALPDDYTVYPGHGEPTTIEFERKNNPYVRA